jgi:hypothetical protein
MKNLALQISDGSREGGEPKTTAEATTPVAPTIEQEIEAAWAMEPRCAECGERIASPKAAAFLVTIGRVAHRDRCFVEALVRDNPLLRQLAALKRAKEAEIRRSSRSND